MHEESANSLKVVPWNPQELTELLVTAPFPWWIAGGWALDLFTGKPSRPHFDLDVAIARQDQLVAQQYLQGWDFQYVIPGRSDPVVFHSWELGQRLGFEIPGTWARERHSVPWRFEFLFQEIEGDRWSFRYCPQISYGIKEIGNRTVDGIPYLQPEIVLLTKAVRRRRVDEEDFAQLLPHLNSHQRAQLAADLLRISAEHPWLRLLAVVEKGIASGE